MLIFPQTREQEQTSQRTQINSIFIETLERNNVPKGGVASILVTIHGGDYDGKEVRNDRFLAQWSVYANEFFSAITRLVG